MTIWRKPIVAVLTSTLVLAHGEPFFALGRAGGNATEKSSVAAAQREESPGYVRNPTALRATPATVRLPAIDFERARRTLTAQREVIQRMLKEPRIAGNRDDLLRRQVARIDKALLYVDISRSHGAVRHELIRRLPVTISETAAAGERAGTYRDYSVGGKVRVRVFLPESVPTVTADRDLEQPDDMSPFEQPDGESPAEYAREDCFYEDDDGPFSGPCVTQQDIDDAAIVEADLLANEDAMVADADSAYSDISNYCQQNPCAPEVLSGPSVFGPLECLAEGASAVGSAGTAVYHRVKLSQMMGSGAILTVPAAALAWKVTLAFGAAAATVIFIGSTVECYRAL